MQVSVEENRLFKATRTNTLNSIVSPKHTIIVIMQLF